MSSVLLRALVAVITLGPAAGCAREPRLARIGASDRNIRYIGRFDEKSAGAVRFAWPGSQIEARFTGSYLRARLTDTPVEDDTRETDWITVIIDDTEPKTFALAEGLHVYPIAANVTSGSHHASIWKRTEAEVGVVSFHGFDLDKEGGLQNLPPPRARHMLVIGDSTTAGYGNEGADGSCHWSASRENNYRTYGAYAARELDATYVAVAWSGKGLTRNYDTRDVLTLPAVFDRTIPTEKESPRMSASEPADVVVLNLGTNDLFLGVPDEHGFIAAYHTFVGSLRARHPDALIVLVLGPMLADDYPQPNARSLMRRWLNKVREEMQARGDVKVELIEQSIDPAEGVGCDFHPNTKSHARLGHELATLIGGRLGW